MRRDNVLYRYLESRRCRPRPLRLAREIVIAAVLFALATASALPQDAAHVEIGHGRRIYLVCAGVARADHPTAILVSGYHDSSDPWTQRNVLSLLPPAVGPAVLPALARNHRVCAYDRPGTVRYVNGLPLTDRSTPVRQPRTTAEMAAELHTLLAVAKIAKPYVLVGHSLGGLIALAYARTYRAEVRGIVFVDALSPTLRKRLGRRWPLYRMVLNPPPRRQPIAALRGPTSETVDIDASIDELAAAPPLARMPLAVLTKTESFRIAADALPPGITLAEINSSFEAAQGDLVRLAPATPHVFATGSEHYILLSQPDVVVEATELVIRRAAAPTRVRAGAR